LDYQWRRSSQPRADVVFGEKLAPAQVKPADEVGWSGDAIEAQAFAYLAVRTLRGLPSTFPTTTGVPMPMRGGIVTQPAAQ